MDFTEYQKMLKSKASELLKEYEGTIKFIVTYVDIAYGKPKVLAVCNTEEAANKEFLTDWDYYIYHLKQKGIDTKKLDMDVDKMSIRMPCTDIGREWNIDKWVI